MDVVKELVEGLGKVRAEGYHCYGRVVKGFQMGVLGHDYDCY